jgi:hypothetical protein
MARLGALVRKPFSFLSARSTTEDRVAAYLIREHERGRSLSEILGDPYVKSHMEPHELDRVLERPELLRALGDDVAKRAEPV